VKQLKQLGQSATIQGLREAAATYLKTNEANISASDDFMAPIIRSLNEPETKQGLLKDLQTSLDRNVYDADDKKAFIEAYAEHINVDKVWVDSGFFAAIAGHLKKNIFIVRQDRSGHFFISEKFSKEPLGSKEKDVASTDSLFIYYNGENHYQGFDQSSEILPSMIAANQLEQTKSFLQSLKDLKKNQNPAPQVLRQVQDMKENHPKIYQAILIHFGAESITEDNWGVLQREKLDSCDANNLMTQASCLS
jgi:hypothetical protein